SCWTTTTRRRVTRGSSPRAVSGSWRIWAPRTARTSARSGCRASSRSPPVSACRSDSPSSSSRDDHHVTVTLRYAARSDVGLVRSNNQDSAYAGPNLLVVADGMGGHAGGDVASALTIAALVGLDRPDHSSEQSMSQLERTIDRARQDLVDATAADPDLAGMGTTVTALLKSGNTLAMAHLGDSRAYLLRDGVLAQVTVDHTFVQHLVDTGRITPDEAE